MPSRFSIVLNACVACLLASAFLMGHPAASGQSAKKSQSDEKITYTKNVRPLMEKYCISCHGDKKPRAGLNLNAILKDETALSEKKLWEKVATMLRAGEMPPPNKPRPNINEIETILSWIDHDVFKVNCDGVINPGAVTIRRLNRAEYNNTIRDLVGIDFKPAKDFPDDDVGYGFDNIGDVLTLSPLLLEKYLKASEQIVNKAWKDSNARKKIMIKQPKHKVDWNAARAILKNFGDKAYRRPITNGEVERLVKLVRFAVTKGDSIENGIKLAVQAMLVSPHFIFRVEENRSDNNEPGGYYLNDYEIANRLSYFLWSSMPDQELFELAEEKKLRNDAELAKQARRMMKDKKGFALVKNFAGQWLQLRNLAQHAPATDHFPSWSNELRDAMIRESELFFEAIMKEDRKIMEFLDADFTFVNERLAKHYGIGGVKGKEFQKVKLTDGKRGGILTHGSILTITSSPTRTSPVLRGKWILENLLNAPPPPPPPEVPELSEDKQEIAKGSLRQRLEMHRSKAECATCHNRMDPLGFGLENFDGIGAWRDKDGKFPIDSFGELPTGEKFNGPKELRQVLKKNKGQDFRRCFAEKMLTYALGRGLEYYDRCAVDNICERMTKNQDRFSSMIIGIVQSDPFLKRRGWTKGGKNE